ncbi:rootletin [Clonorchis sinensis]|uniref:Rootletin n=1 Tax=Clonorchis sinensis TaxID=79923 RepID=G7YKW6_CLOSI|nr:rootletin [Clonorchis sinensis]
MSSSWRSSQTVMRLSCKQYRRITNPILPFDVRDCRNHTSLRVPGKDLNIHMKRLLSCPVAPCIIVGLVAFRFHPGLSAFRQLVDLCCNGFLHGDLVQFLKCLMAAYRVAFDRAFKKVLSATNLHRLTSGTSPVYPNDHFSKLANLRRETLWDVKESRRGSVIKRCHIETNQIHHHHSSKAIVRTIVTLGVTYKNGSPKVRKISVTHSSKPHCVNTSAVGDFCKPNMAATPIALWTDNPIRFASDLAATAAGQQGRTASCTQKLIFIPKYPDYVVGFNGRSLDQTGQQLLQLKLLLLVRWTRLTLCAACQKQECKIRVLWLAKCPISPVPFTRLWRCIGRCASLRKEVASAERRVTDLQGKLTSREKEFKQALDHATCEQSRLTEARNQLQSGIEAVNADVAELRLTLNDADTKILTLESSLSRSEEVRRELEQKLGSIHSSLRRLLGYRQGRRSTAVGRRAVSKSPARCLPIRGSPTGSRNASPGDQLFQSPLNRSPEPCPDAERRCGRDPGDCGIPSASDLDPECVRLALHEFLQRHTAVKRDLEDAYAQIQSLQARLQEQSEQTEGWARRLHQVQQALCEAEAGRRGVDGQLSSTQTALMLQEEALRKNERDRKLLGDKISQLERQLAASESEKREEQEKLEKMRQAEARLEEELRLSRCALEEAENRITQLEVARRSLEGELQRSKLCVTDKETENNILQDRIDTLCKQIQELESKSQSLQITIDRLSSALSKSEELGNVNKDKIHQLNLSLAERVQTIEDLENRLHDLQKSMANCDQDRRIVQERLENVKSLLQEQKLQNQQLLERIQALQAEINEGEAKRSELEGQIRKLNNTLSNRQQSEQDTNKQLQLAVSERQELQERVSSLQRALYEAETERELLAKSSTHLEKDRQKLRRNLEKVEREKLHHEEILNKGNIDRTGLELTLRRLEEENTDQKRQVQYLQSIRPLHSATANHVNHSFRTAPPRLIMYSRYRRFMMPRYTSSTDMDVRLSLTRLTELEHLHAKRLTDVANRHREETEREMQRLKNSQAQAERALEARERAHRQRVRSLEEQMAAVKEQLACEQRKRQQTLSTKPGRFSDIPSRDMRQLLEVGDAVTRGTSATGVDTRPHVCPGAEKRQCRIPKK